MTRGVLESDHWCWNPSSALHKLWGLNLPPHNHPSVCVCLFLSIFFFLGSYSILKLRQNSTYVFYFPQLLFHKSPPSPGAPDPQWRASLLSYSTHHLMLSVLECDVFGATGHISLLLGSPACSTVPDTCWVLGKCLLHLMTWIECLSNYGTSTGRNIQQLKR